MERVKQDMQKADKLCFEAQSIISNYGRIRKISIAHRNFEQADKFYQQVQEFQDKWAHVNQLLQEADARFTSFDFNLLPIHYYLHKLEEFRENAVIFMQTDDFDVYSTLNMMFIELDKLVNALDRFLWKVASHLYEIAINGRNHLIVQLVKIVEIEEKTDETLAKSKERIKRIGKHNHHHKQQQQQPQQIQDGFSETEGQRKPKHYRDKLMRE
ncbi:SNARE-binding exocyst subunit S6, partial [Spiromyces aspiralis]